MKFSGLIGTATEIMHDKEATTMLYCCEMIMDKSKKITNPEFKYKWFSKEELINSKDIVESDKIMTETFFYKRKENYLKLDCYREDNGNYYWK